MQSSIKKELNAALSLASYFARKRQKNNVNPIDLFLALLSLEVFCESITKSANEDDDEEGSTDDILEMLGSDRDNFFTTTDIARSLLDEQEVTQPDNSTMFDILLQEDNLLPLSDGTQTIIDCTSCMADAISGSEEPYLSILGMATAGSDDPEINELLSKGKVPFEQLEEQFFLISRLATVFQNVGSCIVQGLSNNGLENSINVIFAVLSGPYALDFLATLFNLLVLSHEIGRDCEKAPIKINKAYSIFLTLWIEDSDLAEFIQTRINEAAGGVSLLNNRTATDSLIKTLTEVIKAIPLPPTA